MSPFTKRALAFGAGFIDTATFVHITGIFAAHVTGNIVIFAAELAQNVDKLDYLKLLTIPIFVAGVVMASWMHGPPRRAESAEAGKQDRYLALLLIQASLITALGLAALSDDDPAPNATGLLDILVVLGLVVAMGMQNALHRLVPGPMTMVMTGNVAQVIAAFVLRKRSPSGRAEGGTTLDARGVPWLILVFVFGCVASALITVRVGLASALIPGCLLLLAVLVERARGGRPRMRVSAP
jgi:uncharacterized membrane protein YoaK (UPF0700 family)